MIWIRGDRNQYEELRKYIDLGWPYSDNGIHPIAVFSDKDFWRFYDLCPLEWVREQIMGG